MKGSFCHFIFNLFFNDNRKLQNKINFCKKKKKSEENNSLKKKQNKKLEQKLGQLFQAIFQIFDGFYVFFFTANFIKI